MVRFDPDGHYTCQGNKTQCGQIAAGIAAANKALAGDKLTAGEKGKLKEVIGFLGKATDVNGVVIKFDSKMSPKEAANTDTTTYAIGGTVTTITFNTKYLPQSTASSVAETEVHEGTHGIDGKNRGGRDPANKAEELQTERNAYTRERYVSKGLGEAHPGGSSPADIERDAQDSTRIWCANGGNCK